MKDGKEYGKEIVRLLRWIHFAQHKVVTNRIDQTGVYHSQHRMLMCLSDHPNISQKELSQEMDISTSAVAVTLKKLEKGGYIEKIMDTRDNRFNKIDMTAKGSEVVAQSIKIFQGIDLEMIQGFQPEEMEQFVDYLERLLSNLNHMDENQQKPMN